MWLLNWLKAQRVDLCLWCRRCQQGGVRELTNNSVIVASELSKPVKCVFAIWRLLAYWAFMLADLVISSARDAAIESSDGVRMCLPVAICCCNLDCPACNSLILPIAVW